MLVSKKWPDGSVYSSEHFLRAGIVDGGLRVLLANTPPEYLRAVSVLLQSKNSRKSEDALLNLCLLHAEAIADSPSH
jgi:hypothetical protein